jgi:signal transduction histidine kinase
MRRARFHNSKADSSSQGDAQNLKFERADWTSFRTVEGLQQKAGVAQDKLIRLVLKELADNGLDAGAEVTVGEYDGGFFVEDEGPGLDPYEIPNLFSIARPLTSTKMLRLPTRGALGNGLRVAAGAVLASDGKLAVISRGVRQELKP